MRTILFFTLLLLFSEGVFAGWVITEESTDPFGNRLIQTTFIQNNLIRHETPTSIAIIDLDKKIVTMIFTQYRMYWSGTSYELKQSTIEIYDGQMERMLVGLSEYQRKELDSIYISLKKQMLDSNTFVANPDISVIETNVTEEMLGYKVVKYDIVKDSTVIESVWHTTEVLPYNDIDLDNMISFMKQLNQGSAQGSISQTNEYLNLLRSGMLLKSTEFLPDSAKYETVVTNIREINIALDFFLPPNNYRKAALADILNLMPVNAKDELDR